ncbi:MAG: protein translocase subunit SecD [Alphaproteobacteria bacterium]|jgi:preprotein translocase subunit SecD|nr:protein translocase subunit SecD [Alphaproteobacteria bacterium]
MLNFPLWKSILSIVVIIISLAIVGHDFYNKFYNDSYTGGIKLGLDLQGGSSLVLEADENIFLQDYTAALLENIRSILIDENIAYSNLSRKNGEVSFIIKDKSQLGTLRNRVFNVNKDLEVDTNGDLVRVIVSDATKNSQIINVIQNSIEVVRRRVDQTGTSEPSIKQQGYKQIVVELPGVENPDQIKRILGTTARLTFHMVDANASFGSGTLKPGYTFLRDANGMQYAVKINPEIYGKSLVDAKLEFQDQQPVVFFKFDSEAGKKFAQITTDNVGNMFAVVLDNKIISAPRINQPITGGSGIITGRFSLTEAQELALLLKAGGLPVPLSIIEERTIGPTLGAESIKAGIVSGIIGYFLVFIFMVIFYRQLGMIANLSLMCTTVFILAALSLLGATLTLPGIAGIILSLGMAVDANILVYERYSQEMLKKGNTFKIAISNSFKRVFVTILDSNLTTLFVAVFLFGLGSGAIRGFAVTLIIGIITSMFSIMFITRFFINIFLIKNNQKKAKRA